MNITIFPRPTTRYMEGIILQTKIGFGELFDCMACPKCSFGSTCCTRSQYSRCSSLWDEISSFLPAPLLSSSVHFWTWLSFDMCKALMENTYAALCFLGTVIQANTSPCLHALSRICSCSPSHTRRGEPVPHCAPAKALSGFSLGNMQTNPNYFPHARS